MSERFAVLLLTPIGPALERHAVDLQDPPGCIGWYAVFGEREKALAWADGDSARVMKFVRRAG